jgi:hypothetical protein
MARPKDLLGWALELYRTDMTVRMHTREVWSDKVNGDERRSGIQPVGGSHLGSPQESPALRAIIEGDYFRTVIPEYEGHREIGKAYATPLLAALARVAGRGHPREPYPFMARVLHRTFERDGDWDAACASMGIIEPVRRPYIEAALHRLYERFHEEPPANYYQTGEAVA